MKLAPRTAGALLAVTVAIVSVLVAAPANATYAPPSGAVFNNPEGNFAARWRIVQTVNTAIRHARKGSRVMIAEFLMDSKGAADALIKARRRGVEVQVVLDGDDAHTGQAKRIARVVNRDNRPHKKGVDKNGIPLKWGRDRSFLVWCKGSCRGPGGNLHAKYYAFTHTGTAHNVVMISSSNLNAGGATRGWNDMYSMRERPKLIKTIEQVHAEMANDTPEGDSFRQVREGHVLARFYPKRKGTDPVLLDLRKVRCHGASGGAGRNGRTAINIAMFAWNNTRGMAIARRILQLASHGCEVSIIYGAPSKQVRLYLSGAARAGRIKLWDSRYDRDGDGYYDLRVHSKYMLINGVYAGDHSAWEVHTGSQNWGRGTLRRGDDNTINITSRRAYAQYIRNWDTLVAHGRRIGGPASQTETVPNAKPGFDAAERSELS